MDIIRLYQDYSIDFVTEGHKHARPGWVNVECPWCTGNPGYHLGYNLDGNFYVCWRCGFHPIIPTASRLLKLPEDKTRKLIQQYGLLVSKPLNTSQVDHQKVFHKLPSQTAPLSKNHLRYLEGRAFNPERLIHTWNLLGTGPISILDGLDYKHRIIIPFIWNDQQVSFDSRDITNKAKNRYQACPKNRELIPHKSILYGKQECWRQTGICVEGPTDVWRFGTDSFATSGIKYTPEQVRQMAKAFKRIAVCYDDDPQAIIQSKKLVAELRFRGVDAFRIDIEGDPGSMKQDEADYLVKQLIH